MALKKVWPLLLTFLVIGIGIIAGRYPGPSPQTINQTTEHPRSFAAGATGSAQQVTGSGSTNAATSSRQRAADPNQSADGSRARTVDHANDQSPELIQPPTLSDYPSYWPFFAVFLLLATALVLFFKQSGEMIIEDSPEFERALRIWHPLIYARQNTPRSVKRFINRVRYLAMQQRPVYENRSRWQALFLGIERSLGFDFPEASVKANTLVMPESVLVALAAMHYINPAWLQNDRMLQEGAVLSVPMAPKFQLQDETEKDAWVYFQSAKSEHIKVFNNWILVNQCRDAFLKLSAGIRVN
jgi:hypothetical protein